MRTFTMSRGNDQTGISGTGIVLEGAEFSDGSVVLRWMGPIGSVVIHNSLENFLLLHVYPHPTNRSILKFSDGSVITQGEDGRVIRA